MSNFFNEKTLNAIKSNEANFTDANLINANLLNVITLGVIFDGSNLKKVILNELTYNIRYTEAK